MTKKVAKYEYINPIMGTGHYAETVAVFEDGTQAIVDCQYGVVLPLGKHADDCDQINKMGGRCTCGLLDGIDVEALVADARINGKRGFEPVEAPKRTALDDELDAEAASANQPCPHCGTYCYGDCQANK